MPRTLDKEDITEVLRGIRNVAGSVRDVTRDCFGDPFVGRLTDEECRRIADKMEAVKVGGSILFRHGMTLTWTKVDGKVRFELSAQCEQYATMRTAVHEYFKQMGLVDGLMFVH